MFSTVKKQRRKCLNFWNFSPFFLPPSLCGRKCGGGGAGSNFPSSFSQVNGLRPMSTALRCSIRWIRHFERACLSLRTILHLSGGVSPVANFSQSISSAVHCAFLLLPPPSALSIFSRRFCMVFLPSPLPSSLLQFSPFATSSLHLHYTELLSPPETNALTKETRPSSCKDLLTKDPSTLGSFLYPEYDTECKEILSNLTLR